MKRYYVYILRSKKRDFIYYGYTTNLVKRFRMHNSRKVISTRRYAPLDLIFYEAYISKKDAKRREMYFKKTKGKVAVRMMLKNTLHPLI